VPVVLVPELTIAGAGTYTVGTGRKIGTYRPEGGIPFRVLNVAVLSNVNTITKHPYIWSVEYVWRKERPTRWEWRIYLDTMAWCRSKGKDVDDLLTQLAASRNSSSALVASITNIMNSTRLTLKKATVEKPGNMESDGTGTVPVGYTLLTLTEPI